MTEELYVFPYINSINHFPKTKNIKTSNKRNDRITRMTLVVETLSASSSWEANFGKRIVPTARGTKEAIPQKKQLLNRTRLGGHP